MLDLTQVHLAKKEDEEHELEWWARLFYASTWEGVKQEMEEKNTAIAELKSLNEKKDAIIASLKAQIAGFQKP